jgi:hypothetical protein
MLYGAEGENQGSQEALVESFQPEKRFYQEFGKAFGSRLCPEIIHANLDVPEERKRWVERGGKRECALLCGQTVRILFDIIGEKEGKE